MNLSNIIYELWVNDLDVQQCVARQSLYLERSDPFAAPDDVKRISFKFSPYLRGFPFLLTSCCAYSYTGKQKMLQPNRREPSKCRLLVVTIVSIFRKKGCHM